MNDFSDRRAPPRLFCETPLSAGAKVELSERASKHVQALRLRVGDALTLFCGDGSEWDATLSSMFKRGMEAAVGVQKTIERESPLQVHLLQGICAGDRMDLIVQKATELGVTSIQPLVTTRSIVRLSSERQEKRETHWQNVAIAACEQCGRNRIPLIHPSLALNTYLGGMSGSGFRILLSPEGAKRLRELNPPTTPVFMLIGPEGGLSGGEEDLVLKLGFVAVNVGPRVLRTETAPLAALAAMQAFWGDS